MTTKQVTLRWCGVHPTRLQRAPAPPATLPTQSLTSHHARTTPSTCWLCMAAQRWLQQLKRQPRLPDQVLLCFIPSQRPSKQCSPSANIFAYITHSFIVDTWHLISCYVTFMPCYLHDNFFSALATCMTSPLQWSCCKHVPTLTHLQRSAAKS